MFMLVEHKNVFKSLSIDSPAAVIQQRDDACENVARADCARERPLLLLYNEYIVGSPGKVIEKLGWRH